MADQPPADLAEKRWHTSAEAADYLGCSIRTLTRHENNGLIRPYRTDSASGRGGTKRYLKADLDALLNSFTGQYFNRRNTA